MVSSLGQTLSLQGVDKAKDFLKYRNIGKEAAEASLKSSGLNLPPDKMAEALAGLSDESARATQGLAGIKNAFTGIKTAMTPLMTNPLTWAVGLGVAAVALEDLFTVDYGEALDASLQSMDKFNESKQTLQNYESQLETTQARMSELQHLKNTGTITNAEEQELNNLRNMNSELERAAFFQKETVEADNRKAAKDAAASLDKKTQSVAQSVQAGDTEGKKSYMGIVGKVTTTEAVEEDVKLYQDYTGKVKDSKEEIKKLEKELKQTQETGDGRDIHYSELKLENAQKELEQYEESMGTVLTDMQSKTALLQEQRDSLVASGEYPEEVAAIDKALSAVDSLKDEGLSKSQKNENKVDSFFNKEGTSGIRDYLTEVAKAAKSTDEIENAITGLGLSADSFGTKDLSPVVRYFSDIAKEAQRAAEEAEKVDGTMGGVEAAFQTENEGDEFVHMKDYIESAKSLKEQGLTGTDDYKTVEKMITQGTGKDFDQAYEDLQRYYTVDNDPESAGYGQLSRDGIQNFVDDYERLGQTFNSTGEAAKAMGVSTQVFEALMGRVSDYEGFDNVQESFGSMLKSSKELTGAQTALAGLKDLYSETGASEDELNQLDQWEEQLKQYDEGFSELDPVVTARIKFAYDQAQLQQEIENAERIAENGGNSGQWAEVLGLKELARDNAEEEMGFNQEGFVVPEQYQNITDTIENLKSQLNGADEDEKVGIQMEISNLYDLQNQLLNTFAENPMELDADSTVEEVSAAWQEFMDNMDAESLAMNIDFENEEALERFAEIFGMDVDELKIQLGIEDNATETLEKVSEEELTEKVVSLTGVDDATPYVNLWNLLSANPKFSSLSADDQASLVVNTYNSLSANDKNSLISQTGGEASKSIAEAVLNTIASIPNSKYSQITLKTIKETINKVANVVTNTVSNVGNALNKNGNGWRLGGGVSDGTAHSSGTALWKQHLHSRRPTFSGGNWGLPQSEHALINELGGEIIVRNGSWFMLNNGYPTFADLRAGDIIFNHRQTKEILSNGYVTGSHAKLIGSAHAAGTASSLSGRAYASGTDDYKEYFDGIDIFIDRMEEAFKKITDSIEGLSYNLTEQNRQVDNAISRARSNIASLQQSYSTYMDQANSVGLSENWASAVRNGDQKVSEITDKDLKEKIDDYQKYYEKALDVQKKITDMQEELLDLAVKKLKNIDEYFSNRFDYNDDFGYASTIEELQKALAQYQNELNTQVASGTIRQYSSEWYDAQKKIADYTQKVLEAAWKKFEDSIDYLSRVSDKLKDSISLKEAKGQDVPEEDYQKQLDNNNESIRKNYELREKLLKQQAVYDVGSKLYDDLAKQISKADSEIFKLLEDNEKIKDSIWETRFENPFEKVTDGLEQTIKSADKLRSLMDDDSFFDENGGLTDNGLAALVLLSQSLSASKQMVAEYTEGLKKLDEAYQNGILSQSEYEKSQSDFLKGIQGAVSDVQDYKEEIIDLYKEQLKAEVDYMQDYYDKRKDALDLEKDYYEFSKKVSSQSKSVNQLKAQIAALQGVNNTSAQAELIRLQEELKAKEEDLAETKRDHAEDMQKEGYNRLSDELDESMDDTLHELTMNADRQEQVVSEMLSRIVGMYGQAYDRINEIIANTGFTGDDSFHQSLTDFGSQEGAKNQTDQSTAGQNTIRPSDSTAGTDTGPINNQPGQDAIVDRIQQEQDIHNRPVAELKLSTSSLSLQEGKSAKVSAAIRPTDAANKTLAWKSSNTGVASVSGGTIRGVKAGSAVITCSTTDGSGISASVSVRVSAPPRPAPPAPSGGGAYGGIPFHSKVDSYPKNRLNINTSIVDRLKWHNFDSSMSACRELYGYWGGSGYYSGTYSQNVWLISKMKSAGYRKGSTYVPRTGSDFIHDGELVIRPSDGGMLVPLKQGDGVIPSGLTDNLWELARHAPGILNNQALNLASGKAVFLAQSTGPVHAEFQFQNLLNIEGNADESVIDQLKDALPGLGRELTAIVSKELAGDYRKLR